MWKLYWTLAFAKNHKIPSWQVIIWESFPFTPFFFKKKKPWSGHFQGGGGDPSQIESSIPHLNCTIIFKIKNFHLWFRIIHFIQIGHLWDISIIGCSVVVVFFLMAKFCQNLTYTKDFSWKKLAQIHQVLKKAKSNLPDFYDKFH